MEHLVFSFNISIIYSYNTYLNHGKSVYHSYFDYKYYTILDHLKQSQDILLIWEKYDQSELHQMELKHLFVIFWHHIPVCDNAHTSN